MSDPKAIAAIPVGWLQRRKRDGKRRSFHDEQPDADLYASAECDGDDIIPVYEQATQPPASDAALTQPGEVVAWEVTWPMEDGPNSVMLYAKPDMKFWPKDATLRPLTYADTRDAGEERQRAEAAEQALKVAVGELIALVPSVYMAHHKEDNTQTRAREAFNRCREMTIQNIQTHFAIKAAQAGRGGEG